MIIYFNEDSGNFVCCCNEMGVVNKNLNNINNNINNNLDNNFDADDPDNIFHVRVLTWHYKFEKPKGLIKNVSK